METARSPIGKRYIGEGRWKKRREDGRGGKEKGGRK